MIDKSITIGELMEKYPEKINILLEAGMECLGCFIAADETLEQACEVHGLDPDDMVKALNGDDTEYKSL